MNVAAIVSVLSLIWDSREFIVYIVGVGAAIYAWWKQRENRNVESLLKTLEVVIEAAPEGDPLTIQIKNLYTELTKKFGLDRTKLEANLNELTKLAEKHGWLPRSNDLPRTERCALLLQEYLHRKAAKATAKVPMLLVLIIGAGLFIGCHRLTIEDVWEPTGNHGRLVFIEWPVGVQADDVLTGDTTSSDGVTRAKSMAEIPGTELPPTVQPVQLPPLEAPAGKVIGK